MRIGDPQLNDIRDHYEEQMPYLDPSRITHNPLHKTLEREIAGFTAKTSECTYVNGIHSVRGYLRNACISSVEVKLEDRHPHQLTIDIHVVDFGSALTEHRGITQRIANTIESNYQKISAAETTLIKIPLD